MSERRTERPSPSRRRVIAAAIAGGAIVAVGGARASRAKLAPAEIGYQNSPRGAQRCDQCVNWRAPDACTVVAGPISPTGWCGLFVRKS